VELAPKRQFSQCHRPTEGTHGSLSKTSSNNPRSRKEHKPIPIMNLFFAGIMNFLTQLGIGFIALTGILLVVGIFYGMKKKRSKKAGDSNPSAQGKTP